MRDEIEGDVESALSKLTVDYAVTWMYCRPWSRELFPRTSRRHEQFSTAIRSAYQIRGRTYEIESVAASGEIVMIELIECYPDGENGSVYRTPLVLVLEFKDGKVRRGRHYCDPALSHMNLSERTIEKALE